MTNEPIKENSPREASDAPPGGNEGADAVTEQPGQTTPNTSEAITAQTPAARVEAAAPTVTAVAAGTPEVKKPSYEGFDRVLAFLVLVLAFFLGSFAVTDSAMLMDLATGRRVAQGDYQFGVDPYSFMTQATDTEPATTWVNHSWLYSFLLYILFTLVGDTGVVIVHALLGVGIALVLFQIRDRRAPLLLAVFFVGLAFLALSPRFLMTSAAVSTFLLALMMYFLYRSGAFEGIEPERVNSRLLLVGAPILCLLWVNMDAWFLLGPLVLGLTWGGLALNRKLGGESLVPTSVLGKAFLFSVLACLVNPHLHKAFVLPTELGYALLNIGLPVPEWLAPGGYTLKEIQNQVIQMGPLDGAYFRNPNLGGNIAGWSFFAVLGLGLLTFVLQFMAVGQTKDGGLNFARLVPWTFFGALAFLNVTLVPWFAVVGGAIGTLNLSSYLHERRVQTEKGGPEPGLGRLARFGAFLLAIVALGMAWPGWLHGSIGDFAAPRRVAWRFDHDPGLAGLARQLNELHQRGKAANVYNLDLNIPHYCAWYAPGVLCFMDVRWPLFTTQVGQYAQWHKNLATEIDAFYQGKPLADVAAAATLRKAMTSAGVDHLALFSTLQLAQGKETFDTLLVRKLLLQDHTWTLQFIDGSASLFAWSSQTLPTPLKDYVSLRAKEVFTKVPPERRPPPGGFSLPGDPDTWALYAYGKPGRGNDVYEHFFWKLRFNRDLGMGGPLLPAALQADIFSRLSGHVLGCPVSGAMPWSLATFEPGLEWASFPHHPSGQSLFYTSDHGHAAIPYIAIQEARRALAGQPDDPRRHRQLGAAYEDLLRVQEEHWTNYEGRRDGRIQREWMALWQDIQFKFKSWQEARKIVNSALPQFRDFRRHWEHRENIFISTKLRGQPPMEPWPSFRRQLRDVQIMAAARIAADLQPNRYESQRDLGDLYIRLYFLDAGLERLQAAEQLLPDMPPLDAAKEKENLRKRIDALEKGLKERKVEFERLAFAAGDRFLPRWKQIQEQAIIDEYRHPSKDPKKGDPKGRGLPLAALEQLRSYPPSEVAPEEREHLIYTYLELLLRMGRVVEAANELKELKSTEGLAFSRIQALIAGILGDYEGFERHAIDMEKYMPATSLQKEGKHHDAIAVINMLAFMPESIPPLAWLTPWMGMKQALEQGQFVARGYAVELRVMRALNALESGDGTRAKRLFEEALELAGEYVDRPTPFQSEIVIARRYLDWIGRYDRPARFFFCPCAIAVIILLNSSRRTNRCSAPAYSSPRCFCARTSRTPGPRSQTS